MADPTIKDDARDYNALNDRPFSTIMLVSSALVVGANSLMVVLAIIAVSFVGARYNQYDGRGLAEGPGMVVNVLFWLTLPVFICVVSYVDLGKLIKRTLYPRRLLMSTVTGFFLWLVTLGLWIPCSFQSAWYSAYYYAGESTSFDYCPFYQGLGPEPNSWVPFLGFGALICYCLQLALSIIALRHSREKLASIEAGQQQGLELHKRYKLASGVYTDIDDDRSDSLPSTFACGVTSPAPTAHPPSYVTRDPGGAASPRASSFFSEMSHWRRDVEIGSISGMSHMCTCQCHHGVAPQEQITEEEPAEEHSAAVE